MSVVLVVNSGSSSFKYQLIDMDAETRPRVRARRAHRRSRSAVPRTPCSSPPHRRAGARRCSTRRTTRELPIPDHTAGFAVMLDAFAENGPSLDEHPPIAVGHRVVHGGARFFEPTLITPLVEINIDELSVLAPLHNPANLAGHRRGEAGVPRRARTSRSSTRRSTRPCRRRPTPTRSTPSSRHPTASAATASTARRTSS